LRHSESKLETNESSWHCAYAQCHGTANADKIGSNLLFGDQLLKPKKSLVALLVSENRSETLRVPGLRHMAMRTSHLANGGNHIYSQIADF